MHFHQLRDAFIWIEALVDFGGSNWAPSFSIACFHFALTKIPPVCLAFISTEFDVHLQYLWSPVYSFVRLQYWKRDDIDNDDDDIDVAVSWKNRLPLCMRPFSNSTPLSRIKFLSSQRNIFIYIPLLYTHYYHLLFLYSPSCCFFIV